MKSLGSLFDPKTGEFVKNIRRELGDPTELRESLQTFGWRKEFPALADERGVVLVGHRRLALAKELGIEPVIETLVLGKGEAADVERMQIALVSNLGHQPITKADRQRLAEYLYGEREWTMERIAEALGVVHSTIVKDLNEFVPSEQIKPAKTLTNPKGAGRPKGSGTPKPRMNETLAAEIAAAKILDGQMTYPAAEKQTGYSNTVLRSAVARQEGRREQAEIIDPATLPMSVQEKLTTAIRQATKRLEREKFEWQENLRQEFWRDWVGRMVAEHAKERDHYEAVIKLRKGVMTRATYMKILSCLHPDRVTDEGLKARYQEAFVLFRDMEKFLLNEKESPTPPSDLPRNLDELIKRKAKLDAERKAQREAAKAARAAAQAGTVH